MNPQTISSREDTLSTELETANDLEILIQGSSFFKAILIIFSWVAFRKKIDCCFIKIRPPVAMKDQLSSFSLQASADVTSSLCLVFEFGGSNGLKWLFGVCHLTMTPIYDFRVKCSHASLNQRPFQRLNEFLIAKI